LVFIQNYNAPFWNHTWTLAVEEHFDLLLPLVLSILIRKNRDARNPFRSVPYLVLAVSIGCLAIRIMNYLLRSDYSFRTHVFPTHLRLDSLLFGVAISYAHHFHGPWLQRTFRPLRHVLIALGAAVLGSAALLPSYRGFYVHTFGFTVHYLGTGALMVGVMLCEVPNNRLTVSLARLATFSYSIFLWHMALMYWAMPPLRALSISWEPRTAIYMIGAMVIGTTMAYFLELPLLRYRDRKFPSRLRASRQQVALPAPAMAASSAAGPAGGAAGQFIPSARAFSRVSA
jgi:peptidoglycan/LPS O-acetylase OafA/YrhL